MLKNLVKLGVVIST